MTKEIVIKVQVRNVKYMKKAMALVASAEGVDSVAIHGEDRDRLQVIGNGMDAVDIVKTIRRKVAYADIVSVGEVNSVDEESDDQVSDSEQSQNECMQRNLCYTPLEANYAPNHCVVVYERPQDSCSIM